ncbi:amidase [Oscillatoria amoena NRMC-F 0135]|nr:amidase [Oscillatoria amoena NRMC-F 0135]
MKRKNNLAFLIAFFLLIAPGMIQAQQSKLYPTAPMESFYDLQFTDAERDSLMDNLKRHMESYKEIHAYPLQNSTSPALLFNPLPYGFVVNEKQNPVNWNLPKEVPLPTHREELAFYPVSKLSVLLKNRKITSTELTTLYINRIKKYGDTLQCVISLLEEMALAQAKKADAEITAGKYRGPLHGIPYGIKDLIAVEGTKTTWGAAPYKDQEIQSTATVVKKLEAAGAVLVVKLTMGALAWGDIWYGGITKNPWNLRQGSSGSSAGSAAATAAGLVAFTIGTETLGSIVSPSTRCGVTGLRPTFGRVSRHGAMALCWSMDKIGPICRSALDCAIVVDVIRGSDGFDKTVQNAAFNYNGAADIKKLKVGFVKSQFESKYANRSRDSISLVVLRSLGISLTPVDLPHEIPVNSLQFILGAEAAAAFDELTRSNRDSLLTVQRKQAWPNVFRSGRFIPAVEYINANRLRQQLIEEYHQFTKDFDVIVAPSFGGNQLLMTNLTGHPCLVMPNGFNEQGGPTSISFLGRLFGEAELIMLGRAFQDATDWDERKPELFK